MANRLYFWILSVSYVKSRRFEHDTDLEPGFRKDGSQSDQLLGDGQAFDIGPMTVHAIAVSGHTPACLAYQVEDAVFVGDTLFMPDVGTARCDLPGGSARTLYWSIRKLLELPASTRLFVCHDYPPAAGRRSGQARWPTSVHATFMSTTASAKMASSPCAPSATPRWRCPH